MSATHILRVHLQHQAGERWLLGSSTQCNDVNLFTAHLHGGEPLSPKSCESSHESFQNDIFVSCVFYVMVFTVLHHQHSTLHSSPHQCEFFQHFILLYSNKIYLSLACFGFSASSTDIVLLSLTH